MPFPQIIDNSMREAWVKCPHFFLRRYVQNWEAPDASIHLHAGSAYAKGLEVMRREFYDNGVDAQTALARGAFALLAAYGDFPAGDHPKNALGMLQALDYYATTFPLATDFLKPYRSADGSSALEFTFGLPLPVAHPDTGEPLIYAGRFDMLAVMNGQIVIYDDKTASQLGRQWANTWRLSSQFTGYIWAAQQFGFNTQTFVIRGVSITAAGNNGHEEIIGYRQQWMVDRWYEQLLREVRDMISAYLEFTKTGFSYYNQSKSCAAFAGCEFLDVCESPSPDTWLERGFVRREYNPLSTTD